ncbi:MAG: sortase [Patescibacteria group bacterium]
MPDIDPIKTQEEVSTTKPYARPPLLPHWIRREMAIFGGMFIESAKFIFVSLAVFITIYGIINGPAVWNNVRWWWYVNYAKDHTGSWWGIKLPTVGESAEPNHTLFIPKIGVEAPVVYAETKITSEIDQLLLKGVVHYADTAYPGQRGNVFITGHSSFYWWSKGEYNNVFSILDKLVVGDVAYINFNNVRYTYKVEDIKVVSPKEISVLEQGDDSILTLMTCTPVGTNYRRLIVRFKQTSPDPKNNTGRKTPPQLPKTPIN